MANTTIKNSRRVFSQGNDLSLPDRVEVLEQNVYKVAYFAEISSDSGTITKPTGSTIELDQFNGGVDAFVNTISGGQPTGENPVDASDNVVDVSSFDASGNYTLSGVPSAYPVALIYILTIKAKDWDNLVTDNIIAHSLITSFGAISGNASDNASIVSYVTSRIASKGYSIYAGSDANTNLSDSTTYYFGGMPSQGLTGTAGIRRLPIPMTGTITAVRGFIRITGTLGTAENSSLYVRVNNTTDNLVSSSVVFNGDNIFSATSLNILVTSSDYIEMKLVTPNFATNPTSVLFYALIFIVPS